MILSVFTPKPGSSLTQTIADGSAIVGEKRDNQRILIYYEGNLYGNLPQYKARVLMAARRLTEKYPTVATMLVPAKELEEIGTFDTTSFDLSINCSDLLRAYVPDLDDSAGVRVP